jgi:hypothetical protein
MSDLPKQPRSISEISHLFLSSVRDKQTGGAPRPTRTPPPPPAQHEPAPSQNDIELTPEEYAEVFSGADNATDAQADLRIPPVTAIIAQHLNGRAHERVKEYARHLAANGERVGLLEVDAAEVRLMCFERSIEPNQGDPNAAQVTEHFDSRQMTESLDEMSWDLDRWLLVLPNLKSPESRSLLKQVDRWTLLSTCDHDGVVSSYRTLKGLTNVHHPRMTLALLETASEMQAAKIYRKLCSVCLQFLGIELEGEPAVRSTRAVAEHLVAHCRPTRDKAQLAGGAQWQVVANFLAKARAQAEEKPEIRSTKSETSTNHEIPMTETDLPETRDLHPTHVEAPRAVADAPATNPQSLRQAQDDAAIGNPQSEIPNDDAISEVIDLPGDAADEDAVLTAIIGGAKGDLLECPLRAPACPSARLAVTRERGLVILAVARKGLKDLRAIAQGYRWLVENRALIGMAVPQLAIDGHRHPRLILLVDHADISAEVLAPMMESTAVTVRAYRKLRWGDKTGLLLEAA